MHAISKAFSYHTSFLCKSCLDNIALNKPAHQDFPYSGFNRRISDASNAVDGLKSNLGWKGEQCVLSEVNQQTATWWVNLTSILSIHHITIYYRTENAQWGYYV